MLQKFFAWYKRNYEANLYLVTFLFLWQLIHLYWLTVDVVFVRLHGHPVWEIGGLGNILISLVDYTEIPAIILASVFYVAELKKRFSWKNLILLIFLNSQWLHLFWITDEVVVAHFTGVSATVLPLWLSWLAILIDYLELPVMYDTLKRVIVSLRKYF